MLYTLKDYQVDAVDDVLNRLSVCASDWKERGSRKSFALSSVTGSGKTIIAATVIEALIHGSSEFDFEPEPGAVVLWISKEPSLNEQTRTRIRESADRIPVGDLVVLDNDFSEDRLEKGNVYFLNTGKLGSGSLLVKRTNNRPVTFWEVLDNTIKDKNLTLYLILDEAHEGMRPLKGKDEDERKTIIAKIINGHDGYAAVPIVWGISATVKRFTDAMAVAEGRGTEPNVVIDPVRVQKSGLLKSSLYLDIPDEKGDFETTFIRDATREFVELSRLWRDYGVTQNLNQPVLPLMVVQIPNKEKADADQGYGDEDRVIVRVLDTIRKNYQEFDDGCVAHVLGDRDDLTVGPYAIPRIKPVDVQGRTDIRVLIAKDAISTGWDCPRAEVLLSLRPARDDTHITQLLGRMVRTPLARSTSDARLDSASCYLPHFDKPTAKRVAEEIMGIRGASGRPTAEPTGPRVLTSPTDLTWNTHVPAEVRDTLRTLPSLPKPALRPRPIKRLLQAAVALAQDELVVDPNSEALAYLFAVLDGRMAQHKGEIDAEAEAIMAAEIRRISARRGDDAAQEKQVTRDADENTVNEAFSHTRRALTTTVANGYLKRKYEPEVREHTFDGGLTSIRARVAALSRITVNGEQVVIRAVEDAADQKTRDWLDTHRAAITNLSEERRAVYDDIRAQAREPEIVDTELPTALRVDRSDDDRQTLPTVDRHVLSDPDGNYPFDKRLLNEWERQVITQELTRKSVVAWYRNPSAASKYSLRVPYRKDGEWKSLQPDFIFIDRNGDGGLTASIVDPHSGHLSGSLERLVGLADFAEKHGHAFGRVDSLDWDRDKALRVLDMKDPDTRAAVRAASSTVDLFNGPLARRY